MKEIILNPSQRTSKTIKKNYKTLSFLKEPFTQIKVIKKKEIKKNEKKKQQVYFPFANSFYYPKPIQAMLKLKQKLSLLDINTISSVLRDPLPYERMESLQHMNRLALEQEDLIKKMIKMPIYHESAYAPDDLHSFQLYNDNNTSNLNIILKKQFREDIYQNERSNHPIFDETEEDGTLSTSNIKQNYQHIIYQEDFHDFLEQDGDFFQVDVDVPQPIQSKTHDYNLNIEDIFK